MKESPSTMWRRPCSVVFSAKSWTKSPHVDLIALSCSFTTDFPLCFKMSFLNRLFEDSGWLSWWFELFIVRISYYPNVPTILNIDVSNVLISVNHDACASSFQNAFFNPFEISSSLNILKPTRAIWNYLLYAGKWKQKQSPDAVSNKLFYYTCSNLQINYEFLNWNKHYSNTQRKALYAICRSRTNIYKLSSENWVVSILGSILSPMSLI